MSFARRRKSFFNCQFFFSVTSFDPVWSFLLNPLLFSQGVKSIIDKGSVCLLIRWGVVLDETMIESTMESTTSVNEKTTSVKTEPSSSSETTESVRPREMVSDQSKEMLEEEEPRGMELDCSSCLLQEQMKEGNYELVSKVAKFWDFGWFYFIDRSHRNECHAMLYRWWWW